MTGKASRKNTGAAKLRAAVAREELERLRVVFDLVGDAVFVLDSEGRFMEANRAACERYGYSHDELLRLNIGDLDTPEEKPLAAGRIARGIAEGGAVFDAVHQTRDGRPIPAEVNTRVVRLGATLYFISVCRDLTERRRAEQAIREREEQLRVAQRYEDVGLLAGGVAHNINNLMTVVTGYAEILLRSFRPDDPARAAAEHIRTAGVRAAAIAGQLMSFSRRQLLMPKIVEIGALISGMAEALAGVAGKGIALSVHAEPGALVAEVDPDQFRRTLEELVANARDASTAGPRTIAVRCRREDVGEGVFAMTGVPIRPGSYALVEVADKGCGIDPAMLPRIFDPFVSTREFGRGLGLPSIYGYVKQSDGFVSIASPPGKGTTVSLYLPLALRRSARS